MTRKAFRVSPKRKVFKSNEQKENRYTNRYQEARRIRETQRWKDLSNLFRREHPLCQWCVDEASAETHHIEPVVDSPELAFNWDNLMALCVDCHDNIHTRMNRGEDLGEEIKNKIESYEEKM